MMPWSAPEDDGIPECLRRDKNNVAPWMVPKCTDSPEGDIDFGLMKLNPAPQYCLVCNQPIRLSHVCINPANNPPATTPNWVPPWQK